MSYFGDMALGSTINFQFTTIGTTGLPTQLAGTTSTTLSVYPQSSTTQITAGALLTTDFDGITGLNAVSIALTAGNGFTTANDYGVVLATGTVGGTNVLGYVVGSFSVENRVARPTSASILAGSFGANAITSTVLAAGAITSTTFTTGAIVGTTFANVLPTNFSSLSISAAGLVAITSSIKKNATAAGFMFVMTDMTTHVPTAGLTVVGTRSLDGGAFGALANSPSNISGGAYSVDFVPADVNGNHVMLQFTNATADTLFIEVITQP